MVGVGIKLFDSFMGPEVAKDGRIDLPEAGEKDAGWHKVTLVGYSDSNQRFKLLNSWGDWGDKGYFTLPYEYVLDPAMADEFETFWM
jgi:C1A family cysteine protease